jgi:hypothetical protein
MSRPRRNQAAVIGVLVVSLCLSAAALRRYHASASAGIRASAEARPVAAPVSNLVTAPAVRPAVKGQSGGGGAIGPMVVFTVYDVGLMPATVHAPAGTLMILIRDVSSGTLGLNIGGQVVNGTLVQSNGPKPSNASGTVTLTTGTYTVSDMSRPGNTATLIVQ